MEIRNAQSMQARNHCLNDRWWCAGAILMMNLQPEASSGGFAVAMWHQVSCFVVSCEMVWTSVLPGPVVAAIR
jgi:hypothetical protein